MWYAVAVKTKTSTEAVLLLHNIRSVHNVGSIFRTADAIGISGIVLSGYTPAPVDRFGKPRKDFSKTALGAEHSISWRKLKDPLKEIARLRSEGFFAVAIEQGRRSVHYRKIKLKRKMLFILGNEVRGLSDAILKHSDAIAEIPMRGKKESLNVSVAAGIALYGILDQGQ